MVVWYRVDAQHYATFDDWGDVVDHYSTLRIIEYTVIRETPKGVWLERPFMTKKFVLRDPLHRARVFAAPTKEQAREDFRLRKLYRIKMLQTQINRAEQEIKMLAHATMHRIKA